MTLKTFTSAELLRADLPEPSWVVRGLIPIGLTVLAGKPKVGKSFLALQAAVAVSTGMPFLDKFSVDLEGPPLFMALEDNQQRLQERLRRIVPAGANISIHFTLRNELDRDRDERPQQLTAWLSEHDDVPFVVIDTAARFRGFAGRRNSYEEDVGFADSLQRIALHYGVGILLLHHERKQFAPDWVDGITGTLALAAVADALLGLRRPERSGPDAVLLVTGRDVEDGAFALRFDSDSMRWLFVGDAVEAALSPERRAILDCLRGSKVPLTPSQISVATQLPEGSVRHLVRKLAGEGLIVSVGKGAYAIAPQP